MTSPRILVVEDESILAVYIRTSLESLGYQVTAVVDTGNLALLEVERQRPDLVLMDIRLKGDQDGIETAEKIYERFDVPVVYLTAYADDDTLQRAKQTASYGYLLKPFDEKDLRPAIEIALNRHSLELKLRQRERWFSATLKSIGDAVAVTDVRGQIIYLNPVAQSLTNWSASEALGQDLDRVFSLVTESGREPRENMALGAIRKGVVVTAGKNILTDRKGQQRPVEISAAPIQDESGSVVGAVLIFREIKPAAVTKVASRRKPTDTDLPQNRLHEPTQLAAQAAQLASLGVMAAGISHEINQPLHAIMVSANSVLFWHKRNQGVLPDVFVKKINDIADYAGRIDQIIRHMHSFWISPKQGESAYVDINEAVRGAMMLIDRKIHTHGIKPQLEIEGESLTVRGCAVRLEQVIINLITNAITSLDRLKDPDKWIRIATSQQKKQALLIVQDNGPAMDDSILDDLLNPSPAYQDSDEGYGINLAISRMFIEELKGQINITGGAPTGTTCTVRFPLVERKREKFDENLVG